MPHRCHSCQPAALNFLQHAPTAWIISQPLSGSVTAYTLWNPHRCVPFERVGAREMEQFMLFLSTHAYGLSDFNLHSNGDVGWR